MQCTANMKDFTVLPTGLPTFSVGKCTASGDPVEFPSETREGFSGGSSKVQIQTLRNNASKSPKWLAKGLPAISHLTAK